MGVFLHFLYSPAEIRDRNRKRTVFTNQTLDPAPVGQAEALVHLARDGTEQQLPELLRLLGKKRAEALIPVAVEQHGLIIAGIDILVFRQKRADRDRKDVSVQNLFVFNLEDRRADPAADHPLRLVIIGKVMRGELGKGHHESNRSPAASGASGTLHIVCWARRDVPQIDRFEAAHIHAHLKGGRATQRMNLLVDKRLLIPRLLIFRQLRGVLFDVKRLHLLAAVELGIMIALNMLQRLIGLHLTAAFDRRAAA